MPGPYLSGGACPEPSVCLSPSVQTEPSQVAGLSAPGGSPKSLKPPHTMAPQPSSFQPTEVQRWQRPQMEFAEAGIPALPPCGPWPHWPPSVTLPTTPPTFHRPCSQRPLGGPALGKHTHRHKTEGQSSVYCSTRTPHPQGQETGWHLGILGPGDSSWVGSQGMSQLEPGEEGRWVGFGAEFRVKLRMRVGWT